MKIINPEKQDKTTAKTSSVLYKLLAYLWLFLAIGSTSTFFLTGFTVTNISSVANCLLVSILCGRIYLLKKQIGGK